MASRTGVIGRLSAARVPPFLFFVVVVGPTDVASGGVSAILGKSVSDLLLLMAAVPVVALRLPYSH